MDKTNRSPLPKLHTKLHELESELSDLFRLSSTRHNTRNLHFDDVPQRIEFLKNLYNTEIKTSSNPRNSEELNHVWERIVNLENRFGEWSSAQRDSSQDNVGDDTSSVCGSCNRKLFGKEEDDDGRRESVSSVSPLDDSQVSVQEDLLTEAVEKEAVAVKGRRWTGFWSRCGVFSTGVLVGAIGVVICLNSCDFSDQVFLHLPPT